MNELMMKQVHLLYRINFSQKSILEFAQSNYPTSPFEKLLFESFFGLTLNSVRKIQHQIAPNFEENRLIYFDESQDSE